MKGGRDLEHPSEKLAESLAAESAWADDIAQFRSLGSITEEPEEEVPKFIIIK